MSGPSSHPAPQEGGSRPDAPGGGAFLQSGPLRTLTPLPAPLSLGAEDRRLVQAPSIQWPHTLVRRTVLPPAGGDVRPRPSSFSEEEAFSPALCCSGHGGACPQSPGGCSWARSAEKTWTVGLGGKVAQINTRGAGRDRHEGQVGRPWPCR